MPNARVVPNVPTFSVDDGFWYSIPDHLISEVEIGRVVRAPLGGRRVRGWVVEVGDGPDKELKDLAGVSGDVPCFDTTLLKTLKWASLHYVAPLSVFLNRATPPNLPKRRENVQEELESSIRSPHPLSRISDALSTGKKRPTLVIAAPWQKLDWLGGFAPLLASGASVLLIAATVAEVDRIAVACRAQYGSRLVAVDNDSDAAVTRSWEQAQLPGQLVVATPRAATWRIEGLAMIVVLEEGRRAMKDRQTPTVHVREIVRTRALVERITPVFFGPTPSVEVLASGADVETIGNRAWPLVEVVDRSGEAPGPGLMAPHSIAAISSVLRREGRVFVYASQRMADPTVKEINARLGSPSAAEPGNGHPVIVGRERDIADLGVVELAIAPNPDGMLMGTGHRTSEEALRLLARLANAVKPGSGNRLILQTFDPSADLIQTMRRGDPMPYLRDILVERARQAMPPSSEMIAVEVRGTQPKELESDLASIPEAMILGPMAIEEGRRWLLTGKLEKARVCLRGLASSWRTAGATVRIDADPIDL